MTTAYRYIPNDVTYWNVGTGTYVNNLDDKSIRCTVSGTMNIISTQAYGEWYFDLYKSADGTSPRVFINSASTDVSTGAYRFQLSANESVALSRASMSTGYLELFSTQISYIAYPIWYQYKITRTSGGVFTSYIKGGVYGNAWSLIIPLTGSNPVTDNTYTTSSYFVIDLDAGDRIANVRFKSLNEINRSVIIGDNTYDVIIIGGQSNAAGYEPNTNLQSEYRGTYTATYIFNGSKLVELNASDYYNNQFPVGSTRFGWDMAMSRYLNNSGRKLILIKYAMNSTGLQSEWGAGDSLLTDSLIKYLNLCQTYLANNNYQYRLAGMIWYQGERDMQQLLGSTNYQANLGQFITNIRANTIPDLKFYIIRPNCIDNGYTYFNQVRAAMAAYVATDTYSYLFDVDDIYTTLHMDAAQYETCGIRVATQILNDL